MITIAKFRKIKKALFPYMGVVLMILTIVSLYFALVSSPIDYQQKEFVRIMYVHVPAAWMSLGVYSIMAVCAFSTMVWGNKISYLIAVAAAPIGLCFSAITLITGSLWGYPVWGTFWVWDARLTSMLILFIFYLAFIATVNADQNFLRAEKPASVVALLGFINVPIIKFSVKFWHTLHQPDSIITYSGPQIDKAMLLPLILMFITYMFYFVINLILRIDTILLELKYDARSY
jgi:heme exporter protein C